MKAIMISIKPKWCVKIMSGKKTIEVRKNKALANAIQKLIDENGYADIYVYCTQSKDTHDLASSNCNGKKIIAFAHKSNRKYDKLKQFNYIVLNGKVIFKFRCYKVEEITPQMWTPKIEHEILKKSCLKENELFDYICSHDGTEDRPFYDIHISDLEIFDEPKELRKLRTKTDLGFGGYKIMPLTKAPQNFCYIESEE